MIEYGLRNEYGSSPPNSDYQILRHPFGVGIVVLNQPLFNEHRFAFYYWLKWNCKDKIIPDLVTFYWHQDLVFPCEKEKKIKSSEFK